MYIYTHTQKRVSSLFVTCVAFEPKIFIAPDDLYAGAGSTVHAFAMTTHLCKGADSEIFIHWHTLSPG
jgi:hypothetical protein